MSKNNIPKPGKLYTIRIKGETWSVFNACARSCLRSYNSNYKIEYGDIFLVLEHKEFTDRMYNNEISCLKLLLHTNEIVYIYISTENIENEEIIEAVNEG